MSDRTLIDTDVIIWHMRGNENARAAIYQIETPAISIITQMELVQGLRNNTMNLLAIYIILYIMGGL